MALQASQIFKSFGEPSVDVLKNISFEISSGAFVALTGKSGSGKSTLLYILSSLDRATSGKVMIDGHDISKLDAQELNEFRNKNMGFIFQSHYLIAELSALENVLLPARRYGLLKEKESEALQLLNDFGLAKLIHRLPRQLSGGEQQRVAIARALVMKPKYLFADEPTGSLDTVNGEIVMGLIKKANKELGTTVILVTHDPDFAAQAESQINLIDGVVSKAT